MITIDAQKVQARLEAKRAELQREAIPWAVRDVSCEEQFEV